jgi:FAD/FMN-containing dehydrogenase
MMPRILIAVAAALLAGVSLAPARSTQVVNDITQLNPIVVEAVAEPTTVAEIERLVADHKGSISIGGARHSQGGQTACRGCLFIDMRRLNHVLAIDRRHRIMTVQSGATWRQIQEALDPLDLSVAIMQGYANFTVGGTLSVNAHGDYVGQGAMVSSVRSFKIVLADGRLVTASRTENSDIFYGAIGGYGGLGVIVEATLDLAQNRRLERTTERISMAEYKAYFRRKVDHAPGVVMHSATIYPPEYRNVVADTYRETSKPLTITARLAPRDRPSSLMQLGMTWVTKSRSGKLAREYVYDPLHPRQPQVVWRNYAASQDANSLEPASRTTSTYGLQEYFVPVERFDDFALKLGATLRQSPANVLNIAIRHAPPDPGTLLSWAPRETFCFVLYFEQGVTQQERQAVKAWTAKLIQLAIDEGGDYYLPYQIVATKAQFLKAYPRAPDFFALKKKLDPTYKFRNTLWEAYYGP